MTNFLQKYRPLYAPDDGGAGGGAAGGAGTGGQGGGGAAGAAGSADPWHKGVDAEIIGHAQNKGWKLDDPKEAFAAAVKQAREAEKHFGVPTDRLLKMPAADAKPEEWKAFHQRLGAPAEAKEYDLSSVKVNGQPLDDALATSIRDAMAQAFVPKDKGVTIAGAVAKALESAEAAKATLATAQAAENVATLEKNWGAKNSPTFNFNLLKAMEGARRLGPEFVAALESAKDGPGYAAIMEGMRRIGAGTSEDTFVERGQGGGTGNPTTREGARARLDELMADPAWGKRLTAGDVQTRNEWKALLQMIDGVAA